MAELRIDGTDLVLHMSRVEKVEGMRGDVRVPLAAFTTARAVPDVWDELRGIRAPGTGVPGMIAVGTRRGSFGKDFAVVHGHGPGVVVELSGGEYSRLVASTTDAEPMATRIDAVAGAA